MTAETTPPFDINEGARGWLLPDVSTDGGPGHGAATTADFAAVFESQMRGGFPLPASETITEAVEKARASYTAAKANVPGGMLTFARISYMPESYNAGVLQWPGIPPESLKKIVRENLAPQLIIGMRCDDVVRYSQHSSHLWRPGWEVVPFDNRRESTRAEQVDIREAEKYLQNSNFDTGYAEARTRDRQGMTDFQRFLLCLTRDTLTFGANALWTDMDNADRVRAFAVLPAGNIRLCGPAGYAGKPDVFAVAVDETNSVIYEFTRDQLTFYVRQMRVDPEATGYPLTEIEIAIRLIQGFQNAVDLNIDVFNRSAIPNGIMTMSGGSVGQRQLDLLNRMFTNLKKGITKAWGLPVMGVPEGSKLEILNLRDLKGTDGQYESWINMLMGAFATAYRFPVRRLGYRISGKGRDSQPLDDSSTALVDDDDPGLAPLLIHVENMINEYVLWSRWPHLRFMFHGKNPKEDARGYEARKNAMTWGESRRETSLPDLDKQADGDADLKKIAAIMAMCPTDPNLAGVYQALVSALGRKEFEPETPAGGPPASPGNRMAGSADPARSEAHGKLSGVRRNSAAEGARSPTQRKGGAGTWDAPVIPPDLERDPARTTDEAAPDGKKRMRPAPAPEDGAEEPEDRQ